MQKPMVLKNGHVYVKHVNKKKMHVDMQRPTRTPQQQKSNFGGPSFYLSQIQVFRNCIEQIYFRIGFCNESGNTPRFGEVKVFNNNNYQETTIFNNNNLLFVYTEKGTKAIRKSRKCALCGFPMGIPLGWSPWGSPWGIPRGVPHGGFPKGGPAWGDPHARSSMGGPA